MYCFSLNGSENLNECCAVLNDAEMRQELLNEINKKASGQCAVIFTDERAELYYIGENGKTAEKLFTESTGGANAELFMGNDVLSHLFSAYSKKDLAAAETALSEVKRLGTSGFELNTMLQAVIVLIKKLSSEDEMTVDDVERIKAKEIDETLKKLTLHSFRPYTEKVREGISAMSLEALISRFKDDMDAEHFSAVLDTLKKIGSR